MQFLADDDVWKEYEDSAMTVPKLLKLTGALRAEDITTLEMVVDTSSQNVTHLGELLPNLSELKLNDSRVCSFRDLGTSLRSLKVLWLARCGITDLDGISSFGSLAELYLAFNDVADVTPLAMHDQIQVRTRALGGGVDAMGGGWRGGVTEVWVEWPNDGEVRLLVVALHTIDYCVAEWSGRCTGAELRSPSRACLGLR